jgi:hypothetical protein
MAVALVSLLCRARHHKLFQETPAGIFTRALERRRSLQQATDWTGVTCRLRKVATVDE